MDKVNKYSLGYAIGNSIQENKNKIAKLEKKVENLKNKNKKLQRKLEEKDKVIDEAINYCNEEISKIQNHQYAIGVKRLNKILDILEKRK